MNPVPVAALSLESVGENLLTAAVIGAIALAKRKI